MNEISVTKPVEHAFERVKQVLFQPFDITKWFIIGFCAWLAYLGEGGGGGGGFGNGGFPQGPSHGGFREGLIAARDYVVNQLYWLLPLALLIFTVVLVLAALFLWLSSRGKFMFLDCVARNVAVVREPWQNYAVEGNSLFLFRLIAAAAVMIPGLVVLGVGAMLLWSLAMGGGPGPFQVVALVLLTLTMVVLALAVWIFKRLTNDFIVPLQYVKRIRCLDAWREFLPLLSTHVGPFVLYFLFRIVLAVAIGAVVIAVVLLTCCVAGCLLALPYLGTVLMLPILVFERSYSLYFFAQLGPQFDVFNPGNRQF